jgi:hypothetical protein
MLINIRTIYCRGQRISGAIPPLSQYAFMAWCFVKAQGQLYLYLRALVAIDSICGFKKGTCHPLDVRKPRPVCVDGRSRWSESYTHWFSCSSPHTKTPVKEDRVAVFWEHNHLCDLLYIFMYHQQRGTDGPLWFLEYRLYTDCTGQEPGRKLTSSLLVHLEEWTLRPGP